MRETRKNELIKNADTSSRWVEGYAIVFYSESVDLGGFTEIITREAVEGAIEKSDVVALLNHNWEKGVLARSRFGQGSLQLSIDGHGLKYRFECPNTALGDELLEGLRRGDISSSSFGFAVEKDEWARRADGTVLRTIKKIKQLYDVSPVYNPAYQETEVQIVDKRGLETLQSDNNNDSNIDISMKKNNIKRSKEEIMKEIERLTAEMEAEETQAAEAEETQAAEAEETTQETQEETTETETEETQEEEVSEDVADETTQEEETTTEETQEEINNENRNTSMKFKLIKTINDVVNNRGLSEEAQAINKEGRAAMNKAGLASNGTITIPVAEVREGEVPAAPVNGIVATVATQGKENVATDKLSILEPLRANMVMAKAGATYMTGLVGDVSIPVYSGSNVGWKGEVVAADNGAGNFSEVILQPKRLTAFVDVSKQFLIQDSNDAEEMLKRDIINAIGEKLEQTILGVEAGDATKPAGLFNNVVADTTAFKFDGIVDMEAALEENNVNDYCYIVAPGAKAVLRKTSKDAGSGKFVMEDGEIEGRQVFVSSAVCKKGIVVGDFKDYVVAQWGALDLTVDPYTKASEGMVRLVINAYFDAKPRREQAFVKRILK